MRILTRLNALLHRVSSNSFFVVLLLLLVVVAVYGEVLTFQFLPFWDDDTNIHRNPLYSPLSWENIALFWKGPFQQLYIPVTYSVWGALVALSRILAGTTLSVGPINPVLFHGMNLVIHLFSTVMVFMILFQLIDVRNTQTMSKRRLLCSAAVGALAFALHPVQVEAVAWVAGLRDLLGGAFSLAVITLFLAFLGDHQGRRRRILYYISGTLLLLLAFGSKPASVVTPALALITGAWLIQVRSDSWRRLLWLIPWFLLALVEVIMTSKSQPAAELARSLVPLWARPLVACDALAFYLGKIAWPLFPFEFCGDYGRSPNSLMDAGILYWTWLIPAALLTILLTFKKIHCYLLPMGILLIGVLPTLGLIPFNFQIVSTVSDRYLYLAMLGPALALGMLVYRVSLPWALGLSMFLLPSWSVLTLLQLPSWADGNTFFQATLAINPTSWKSRHNYACTLDALGKWPEALHEFDEAIRLRPSNAEAHNDKALTLMKLGRTQEAINEFQQSLQIRATTGAARNLASLLLSSGDAAQAVQIFRLSMQIDPGDLQNQRALAWLLATHPDATVRNGKEALVLAEQIVNATHGKVPLFLLTLSAALAEVGNYDQSVAVASQAGDLYQNSGDRNMANFVHQRVLPLFMNHQPFREQTEQKLPPYQSLIIF